MRIPTFVAALAAAALMVWGAQTQAPVESPHGTFAEDCGLCHAPDRWKPIQLSSGFDHSRFGMPLQGRHADLHCGFCHVSLDFAGLEGGCATCHVDAHAGELGPDCAQCHDFESFTSLSDQMRMHRGSSFPLTGAHMTVACERCHPASVAGTTAYRLTDSTCIACHRADYEGVTSPDHLAAGYDTSCERCHRITQWDDAQFDHSQVAGTPCADCHQDDYDATSDPIHTALGFPISCQDCHNTIDWHDGRFAHGTFFPIDSGKHRDKWNECSDCHTNSADYSVFSCLGCHPHSDQQETDNHHDEEPEYAYDSIRCFECHPRGEE